MKKIYVGCNGTTRSVFRSPETPTEASHGDKFAAVIGPFRTIRGAKCMVHFGGGNPHIQCVANAERIGKKYADELALLGETNEQLKPEPINNEIGGPNDYAYGM